MYCSQVIPTLQISTPLSALKSHYRYLALENDQLATWAIKQLANKVNNRKYFLNNKDTYTCKL